MKQPRRSGALRLFVAALCTLFLSSCSLAAASSHAGSAAQQASTGETYGKLTLVKASQHADGTDQYLHLTVRNPYSETVEGVRILFRVLLNREPDSPEITRTQKAFDTVLAPAGEAELDIQLPPEAGQDSHFGTFVHVFAVKRGSTTLSSPPLWKE